VELKLDGAKEFEFCRFGFGLGPELRLELGEVEVGTE
jgi:hypothetical protein